MNSTRKEQIRKILAELEKQHGRLTPDAIVEHARAEDSPLHSHFLWDDDKAAHQFRLAQARDLITSVKITMTTEHSKVEVVAYVRDPSLPPSEQGYISVPKLRSDVDLAREAIVDEFVQARQRLERARSLAVALNVRDDVEHLIQGVERVRTKVESPGQHAPH